MLARRELPPEYNRWNRRWGAPFGRALALPFLRRGRRLAWWFPRLAGPFAFQPNNDTRIVEYPWAFHAVPIHAGMTAVEIGGGLSGFQFVLSRSGVHVTNVDPGHAATGVGWRCDRAAIDRLNRGFRTDVTLENCTLEEAELPDNSADVVYSISAIEHIPEAELPSLMRNITRILEPAGSAVLTIDLFLDLAPFTNRIENEWGRNIDVRALVDHSGLDLVFGDPSELCGFPAFDPKAVLERLSELYYGEYPACAQLLVLEKPRG